MIKFVPSEINNQKILFTALNWGYGHVMRSIVLLKQLSSQNNQLTIVCGKEQKQLYVTDGIEAHFIIFEGYPWNFSGSGNFYREILRNLTSLREHLRRERAFVAEVCKAEKIDVIISDQSMGFFNEKIPSILITHQVNLPIPVYLFPFQYVYKQWLKNFDFWWIPDNIGKNALAGKLSQTKNKKAQHIGPLTRFGEQRPQPKTINNLAVITGPEPYAEQFFQFCKAKLSLANGRNIIIYNGIHPEILSSNLEVRGHCSTKEFEKLLGSCHTLITRPGYSTLMDLSKFDIENKEFYPTPGQKEQEYLLKHHKKSHSK